MRGARWDLASKPFPSTQNPFGSSFEEEDAEGLQADELVQDNLFYLLVRHLYAKGTRHVLAIHVGIMKCYKYRGPSQG